MIGTHSVDVRLYAPFTRKEGQISYISGTSMTDRSSMV